MAKQIPEYCYLKLEGGTFILHTRPPFYIGRVWMDRSLPWLNEQIEKLKPLAYAQHSTHVIAVTLWACLGDKVGNQLTDRLILTHGTKPKSEIVVKEMLDFFEETKMKASPKFYDKFRIFQR